MLCHKQAHAHMRFVLHGVDGLGQGGAIEWSLEGFIRSEFADDRSRCLLDEGDTREVYTRVHTCTCVNTCLDTCLEAYLL